MLKTETLIDDTRLAFIFDDLLDPTMPCFAPLRIPNALLDSFDLTRADLKSQHAQIELKIKSWNEKWAHVLQGDSARGNGAARGRASGASSNAAPAASTGRVLCRPEFDELESPIDASRVYAFPSELVLPYEQLPEPLGKTDTGSTHLSICLGSHSHQILGR